MKPAAACAAFRRRLERALEGRLLQGELSELAWHAHLLGCGECRALLELEEALEVLLASMPEPKLPPALTRRVLARLRQTRSERDGLDLLLELDGGAAPPAGLAGRILEGVRSASLTAQDRELDSLLERDRALELPPALAQRVLLGLAFERSHRRRRFHRTSLALAAAAAAVVVGLPLWLGERERLGESRSAELVAQADARREVELRAFLAEGGLEILDEPLLWTSEEDLEIALAASLDPRYETLFDYNEPFEEQGR